MKNKLLKIPLARQVYSIIGPASGDTIRQVVQKPIVLKYLNQPLGKTLDIGCGSSLYTQYIDKGSSYVVAADVQLSTLLSNKYKKYMHTSWVCADIQDLPFKDSCFDTVVCTEVLEHLDDDLKAIQEIERVLKRNGNLILSVPVPPAPINEENHSEYGHKREGYTYNQIKGLLERFNLKIVRHDFNFLIFSRFAFKLLNRCVKNINVRPPRFLIMLISSLDYLLSFGSKERFKPYDIVIKAVNIKA